MENLRGQNQQKFIFRSVRFFWGVTEERGCLLILRQPPDIKTKFNPSLILIFHQ